MPSHCGQLPCPPLVFLSIRSFRRLEREQIRALANNFSQARDELDLKDAALVSPSPPTVLCVWSEKKYPNLAKHS